jgi:hypothetical protein
MLEAVVTMMMARMMMARMMMAKMMMMALKPCGHVLA